MHINENPNRELILSAVLQLKEFHPEQVWYFEPSGNNSEPGSNDIDICVVMETEKKTETMANLYNEIVLPIPYGILLYTPSEWEKHSPDPGSFANYITRTGVLLYNNKELLNKDTISAINEARNLDSTRTSFKTAQELMADLEIDD